MRRNGRQTVSTCIGMVAKAASQTAQRDSQHGVRGGLLPSSTLAHCFLILLVRSLLRATPSKGASTPAQHDLLLRLVEEVCATSQPTRTGESWGVTCTLMKQGHGQVRHACRYHASMHLQFKDALIRGQVRHACRYHASMHMRFMDALICGQVRHACTHACMHACMHMWYTDVPVQGRVRDACTHTQNTDALIQVWLSTMRLHMQTTCICACKDMGCAWVHATHACMRCEGYMHGHGQRQACMQADKCPSCCCMPAEHSCRCR